MTLLALAAKKGAVQEFIKVFFANLPARQTALSDFLSQFASLQVTLTANKKASLEQLLLHAASASVDGAPDPERVKLMAVLHGALQHAGGKSASGVVDRLMDILPQGAHVKTAGVDLLQKSVPIRLADLAPRHSRQRLRWIRKRPRGRKLYPNTTKSAAARGIAR